MRYLLAALVLLFCGATFAAIDALNFRDEAQEQQFRQLTAELRCPKCQNNSIADSNAMIATDMRQKVYELMQQGQSRQQIIDYMVARYGHFVTYDPPLTPLTALLWLLPVVAIMAGGWVIYARTRRRALQAQDDVLPPPERTRLNLWLFAPGVVIALGASGWSYYQTGGFEKVRIWQQSAAQAPALLERVLAPKAEPLNTEEMMRLALGLRTQLQSEPDNAEGWLMLGHIGMALNNASTATEAFARAYALAPENSEVVLAYAESLTRSSDPDDNRRGGELLRQLVRSDHANIRVLSLFAFNAFEQQRYDEAMAAWQMMLKLLPAGDQRRAVIERGIEQARQRQNEMKSPEK